MALHPQMEAIVASLSETTSALGIATPIDERRQAYRDVSRSLWPTPFEMASVTNLTLPLDVTINARLYVPPQDADQAVIVYFHGGSFVLGDLDSHDGLCRRVAHDTKMRLISVEYRRAPEFPFPSAVNDAIGALAYVVEHRELVGHQNCQIVVMGDSAGATLAAVAAASRRGHTHTIAAQVLLYPTMGPQMFTTSAHDFAAGYLLDREQLRRDYVSYLGDFVDHTDVRVSPLMNLDLTTSPPAIVVVAEYDPLRDEAVAYAGLLEHFGTKVELLEAEGMVHGFLRLGGVMPEALAILDDLAEHLQRLVKETP